MPRLPTPTLRNALTMGAVGAGAVVSVRALLRPRKDAEPRLLDWEAVRRAAYQRGGSGAAAAEATTERILGDVRERAKVEKTSDSDGLFASLVVNGCRRS